MNWQNQYNDRLVSPEEAIRHIKSGTRIFIGTACGEPQTLVEAMMDCQYIEDAEIFQYAPLGHTCYAEAKYCGRFRHNSFFIGPPLVDAVMEGRADYTPIALSEIPRLINHGRIKIDVALICVSPPDNHGLVSLGVSVDIVKAAVENAGIVIAEVNENMPRTLGDSSFHVDQIDYFVKGDRPILELVLPEPDEVRLKVAENVSHMVEDYATIHLGYGIIPAAVLRFLGNRKDLGIHTNGLGDSMVDLVEAGVITNKRKTLHRGKMITSSCTGTRKLYDFVHNNQGVEFHPTDYVSDPHIIAQNDRMTSISIALEVDITGQVAADNVGYRFFSGVGSQMDFVRGAGKSKWGRPIICLPSTTPDESRSLIAPKLSDGAGVVTTRGDVHYVVTEYGIAYLYGKPIKERVKSLIQIAHPKFREELLEFAKEHRYINPDHPVTPAYGKVYPTELERWGELKDGTKVFIRPLKPADAGALKPFFYSLKDQSLYYRFFTPGVCLSAQRKEPLKLLDYDFHMAIGAFVGEPGQEDLIGVANYVLNPANTTADIAFIVRDDWQHKRLGKVLFDSLIDIGKSKGICSFTAEVLAQNRPMMKLFHDTGYEIETHLEEGVYSILLSLERRVDNSPGE